MNNQDEWFDLCKVHGEKKARCLVVAKLRAFADQVEKGGYPDVFGCYIERPGKTLMETVSVTLSHLWPG